MNALYEQFMENTSQPARKSDQGSLCREAKNQQLMEKVVFESLGEILASQKRFFEELKSVKESITVF